MPFFAINTHRSQAQHIREYRHGVADEQDDYFIAVKQYVPISERPAQDGDVTVIACAGIGMIKEIYEPLFEELARRCAANNVFIRAFWIADAACIGESAVLNHSNITNEQSWFDHSRDLLFMINSFRKLMPRPLVGLGHSMGGAQIAYLATIHPNLFHTILFMEPAIHWELDQSTRVLMTKAMNKRREMWPTHAEAVKSIKRNPFYKYWDKRCIELLINNSFTQIGEKAVATKTPKTMEIALMFRPNVHGVGKEGLDKMTAAERSAFPDINPTVPHQIPWYRPEPMAVMDMLPNLRPSALYIVGTDSSYASAKIRKARMENTGIGVGGSGGAKFGRVAEHAIPRGGHYLIFDQEHLLIAAEKGSEWLTLEMKRWQDEEKEQKGWATKSLKEKKEVHPVIADALDQWHPQKDPDFNKIVNSKL